MEDRVLLEPVELTDAELDVVSGGDQPNQNAGGGPGNSGNGDKASGAEGPGDKIVP
jgi:hypothetical protein